VADGSGGHSFAETYDQHTRNVTRWRQIEKTRATTDNADAVDHVDFDDDAGGSTAPGAPASLAQDQPPAPGRNNRQGRPRGFDASEGTDRDPLKNKTFDLNSPKNVPALRQP
jgi:UPF0755 protein